jgi:hypothetical protein
MLKTEAILKKQAVPMSIEFVTIGTAALLIIFLSLHGSSWGRVEDWHPDQMAFKNLPLESFSLVPVSYQKPPFHSYFSLAARLPAKAVAYLLQVPTSTAYAIELLFVRILTVFLFTGSVYLVYRITKRSFGSLPSIVMVLLTASSAGFIAFSHFLTAEIPVTFWMLLALFFSVHILYNPNLQNYLLAGFFTGLAAATKYNGLGMGISLVAAHFLACHEFAWFRIQFWKQSIFNKKLIFGLLMVPFGFLVGNPFALFDNARFINDFMYNLSVTPVYTGEWGGNSYLLFFVRIVEVIGLPFFLVLCLGLLFSLFYIFSSKENEVDRKVLTVLWVTFLVYYLYIGSFPRLETRFVLPIVPVALIIMGPFIRRISPYKKLWLSSLAIILLYNFVSGYYVGKRFLDDPRMDSQSWVMNNIPRGSSIESSMYVPDWNRLNGVDIQDIRMPFISGRRKLFEENLGGDQWVERNISLVEVESEELLSWYSIDKLLERNPDYIAINSLYYNRYMDNPYYPEIAEFFSVLLGEQTGYSIRYQRQTETVPKWIYPQQIDTLANTMVILKKNWEYTPGWSSRFME